LNGSWLSTTPVRDRDQKPFIPEVFIMTSQTYGGVQSELFGELEDEFAGFHEDELEDELGSLHEDEFGLHESFNEGEEFFDRREVLRYTTKDRIAAYRRVLGYGSKPGPTGSRPNTDFHHMFAHFVNQVTLYWRDKRISDVIRERAYDPSFGAIAIVRRAGLDLRNNLKWTSFGHVNVLRVEVMQLLDEAFRILDSDDIKRLFGADNAWDVVEEVLIRYYNERLVTSPRQRMGVAGREVLRWLSEPYILQTDRAQFEALLLEIAEYAEEWLTSAQAMGLAERRVDARVLPWDRPSTVPPRPTRSVQARAAGFRPLNGRNGTPSSEFEF
jgi:hypothetical protein